MDNKFVPLDKQSKRQQKQHYAAKRGSWNGLHPVTRIKPSGKMYDRKAMTADTKRAVRELSPKDERRR